jgi:hypothetical protein
LLLKYVKPEVFRHNQIIIDFLKNLFHLQNYFQYFKKVNLLNLFAIFAPSKLKRPELL